jgi:hypothetical protein
MVIWKSEFGVTINITLFVLIKYMVISVNVDNPFCEELSKLVRHNDTTAMVRDALAIYMWYLREKDNDRSVISCNVNGNDLKKLIL